MSERLVLINLVSRIFSKFGSLGIAMQVAYPEMKWKMDLFSIGNKRAGQRWLRALVEELLPEIVVEEEKIHEGLRRRSMISK